MPHAPRSRPLLAALGASLALALLAAPAAALQPLDEFLGKATAQSFEAREATALATQREAEADVVLGRLLPGLSVRGVYTRNQYEVATGTPQQRILIQPENQLDAFIQLDVPLIDLSTYYRHRGARAFARAATEQRAATNVDVQRAVCRAYFNLIGADGLKRSATRSIEAAEANLRTVEVRRSAGTATELDKERARANVERAKQDAADAALAEALSQRSLETLSGVAATPAGTFPADDLHDEAPLAQWLAAAPETPQKRASRELEASAVEQKKSASTTLVPILSGTATERLTNATGFLGKESTYAIALTAAWRIDYVGIKNAEAQRAALEVARIRTERAARATEDLIFEAHQRVTAGIVKSRSARAQAAAATRAAELAADRYEAGAATQLDVTQAQRDAFLADAGRVQADADLMFARATLRLAAGKSPAKTTEGP